MNNTSIEFDNNARSILKTYQQINDNAKHPRRQIHSKLKQKTIALEQELHVLKEKYRRLQTELTQRDLRLDNLNRQLSDRTDHMQRLQEDYENAIYHFQRMTQPSEVSSCIAESMKNQ